MDAIVKPMAMTKGTATVACTNFRPLATHRGFRVVDQTTGTWSGALRLHWFEIFYDFHNAPRTKPRAAATARVAMG